MSKIAIVTDSTATFPGGTVGKYPIHTIALDLIWGDQTFKDGIDIKPVDFFPKLVSSKVNPTTSQPSPAAFRDLYQRLLDEGNEILSIHISNLLSGTLDSAQQAKAMLPDAKIRILDSETTSICLGYQVLSAARAAVQGATLEECEAIARETKDKTGVLFVVNTLEFLRRGGRIGGASAFIGTALNLKPILEIRGGRVEAIEKVRTWGKALDRMMEIYQDRVDGRTPLSICVLHGGVPEEAQKVLEEIRSRYGVSDVDEAVAEVLGPVVGVHAGPGVIGLAYLVRK